MAPTCSAVGGHSRAWPNLRTASITSWLRADERSHPRPAGGEALGDGVHHDDPVLQPLSFEQAGMLGPLVGELLVDLVGDEEEVVLRAPARPAPPVPPA